MPSPTVDIGTGTTFTFAGFTAEVKNIDWSGISREILDTSHLATPAASPGTVGSKTYIPGDLSDPGSLDVTFHYNPDTEPPIEAAAATLTITFTSGATWVAQASMIDYSFGIPFEEVMEGTTTFKIVGPITVTAAV
jgi:hypothetical protein